MHAVGDAAATPGLGVGVFLSAVSSEFRRCRGLIAADLRTKELEVRVQEEFRQGGDSTILERLHTYIEGCSNVVCLIGDRSGSVPPRLAAQPYLHRYGDMLPANLEEPSYTQWEFIFALALDKQPLVYHAGPEHVPDEAAPAIDHPELQAGFVQWIFDDGLGQYRANFTTAEEARILVLYNDFPVPATRGATIQATVSRSGLRAAENPVPRVQLRARHQQGAQSLVTDRYELRGRETESSTLDLFVTKAHDRFIEVTGPAGAGKKKLLAQLESDVDAAWTDPADADRVEDFVQSAWEHLHAADPSTVVPNRRDRELKSLETLVLAADVEKVEQLLRLSDAMPKARFCLTSARRITDAGRVLEVKNLGDGQEDAMLQIFEDRYLRPVPDELGPHIVEICRSHQGNPAKIVQLAHNAERAASLEEWVADNRPLSTAELPADMSPAWSAPDPAEVVACVGEAVPRDVIVATTSIAATDAAEDACRILRNSPRYRTTLMASSPTPDPDLMADVLRNTVTWSSFAGASEIFDNRAFVVRMTGWGVEQGYWREVLEIGQHAEAAMALGGRHGAWKRVLDDSLVAACALGDRAAEGWALHQLGSRALLREDNASARVHLAQAHAIRREVDPDAAEISRGNLRVAPGGVVSLAAILLGVAVALLFAIALLVPGPPTNGVVDIDVEVWELDGTNRVETVTIENVGTVSVDVAADPFRGLDRASFAVPDDACTETLAPGHVCEFDITLVGDLTSPTFLRLQFDAPGEVNGDRGILVIPDLEE